MSLYKSGSMADKVFFSSAGIDGDAFSETHAYFSLPSAIHTHYQQQRKGQILCQNNSVFPLSPVSNRDKLTTVLWKAGQYRLLQYFLRHWPKGGLCITGPNCCGLRASWKESASDPSLGLMSVFVSLSICDQYASEA